MKKIILLVEEIASDGRPITLLEKLYKSAMDVNRKEFIGVPNFDEIVDTLRSDLYKTVEFVAAKDFIKEVGHTEISKDYEIYYFINVIHAFQTFHFLNLLGIDYEIIKFIKKHNIPIIIDGSMEITNPHDFMSTGYQSKIMQKGNDLTECDQFFHGLDRHPIIVVHPIYRPIPESQNYFITSPYLTNVWFPLPFFYYKPKISKDIISNRDMLFDSIKKKKITENTTQWIAYSYTERLNRMLFFMRVHKENLVEGKGKYSLLKPLKNLFLEYAKEIPNHLKWVTPDLENILDDIKIIDPIDETGSRKPWVGEIVSRNQVEDIMYNVVLETFDFPIGFGYTEDGFTSSMLTEKTAKPIVEGLPFLTFGGQHLSRMIKYFGFKTYEHLDFNPHPILHIELDQVIEKMKWIDSLDIKAKNNLNESWKETIMFNYDRYATINVGEWWIKSIRGGYRGLI